MITFDAVGKAYNGRPVVDRLSLHIRAGELSVLVGPSGCGKSTTLRMINRLIAPDSGTVRVGGQDIARADPQTLRRSIGYAIQAGGLFPHWDVARNIATVPRLLGWPEARVAARVTELLTLLGLPPADYATKRVAQLSGGQQQRVGVARALAADPPVVLLDEPFGALDPVTRRDLQTAFRRIQRDTQKTVVFVTHDMDEALLLADRIFILDQGRLAQQGTPAEILLHPASPFVRQFVAGEASAMRVLAVRHVADILRPGPGPGSGPAQNAGGPEIALNATLRDALGQMVVAGAQTLAVRAADGAALGHVVLADIVA